MRVLFVGRGASVQTYYRIALPAMALGHDWIGVVGDPPDVREVTGLVGGDTRRPRMDEYDVVVMQSPRASWRQAIRALREKGVRVLIEVDDYLTAIGRMGADHDYAQAFGRSAVEGIELNMRLADGVIVTQEFLARKYRKFNRKVWVCRNGLDLGRYDLTRPFREHPIIGWAGGTGHRTAIEPLLPVIAEILNEFRQTRFITIGQPYADLLDPQFPGRCLSLPWTEVETFPCAMTLLDVTVAPAGPGLFYKGKSDLRFLEAGALGIAVVGDPHVYPTIEPDSTGVWASTQQAYWRALRELVEDRGRREEFGAGARRYVREQRSIQVVSKDWQRAIEEVSR